jgi:hypothetical protein
MGAPDFYDTKGFSLCQIDKKTGGKRGRTTDDRGPTTAAKTKNKERNMKLEKRSPKPGPRADQQKRFFS